MAGTPTITHTFQSAKADGPDPTLLQPSHWNASHTISGPGFMPIGALIDYGGHTCPAYFLETYGQSLNAVTYADLFAALVKFATVTMTIASPCVVTWTSHGRQNGDPIKFTTTGALPTGLIAGTTYYIVNKTANTFQVAATAGGTAIDTSGSQSGTHTGIHAPHGCADNLSTFNAPDLRGRATVGLDNMGGTSADRLTGLTGGLNGDVMGMAGGAQSHALSSGENGPHTHTLSCTADSAGSHTHTMAHTHSFSATSGGSSVNTALAVSGVSNFSGGGSKFGLNDAFFSPSHQHTVSGTTGDPSTSNTGSGGAHTHTISGTAESSGSGDAHNNVQPSLVVRKIIFAGV